MAKFRSTYILLGLFLMLLAFVLFYGNEGADRKRTDDEQKQPVLMTTQVDQTDKVVITKSTKETITLTKDDKGWHVGSSLVDPDEAANLVKAFRELPVGKHVSKNKENWTDYGLTDDKATKVLLSQHDTPVMSFFLGSSGPIYQSFYVRKDGDDQVYLVTSNLEQFVGYDESRWIDKRLFAIDKDNIQGIAVRIGDEHWAFSLKDNTWSQVGAAGSTAIAKPEDFQKYLGDLLSLKGVKIETDVKKFQKADNAIDVTMRDGSQVIVSISKIDEKQSYAQVTGRADLLSLNSDLSARLRPSFLEQKQASTPPAGAPVSVPVKK